MPMETRVAYRLETSQLRALPLATTRQQYVPLWLSIAPKISEILDILLQHRAADKKGRGHQRSPAKHTCGLACNARRTV
jgi:hypothetical protein